MRKVILVMIALLMILGLSVLQPTKPASAFLIQNDSLAPNDWQGGDDVTVDMEENPAPEWLQLLTNPVKVTTAGKVCHEFRGGQFYWVGEIRQLVEGQWVKVESTVGWVPTEEGKYMICFEAEPGTYALFAFFSPPEGWKPSHPLPF